MVAPSSSSSGCSGSFRPIIWSWSSSLVAIRSSLCSALCAGKLSEQTKSFTYGLENTLSSVFPRKRDGQESRTKLCSAPDLCADRDRHILMVKRKQLFLLAGYHLRGGWLQLR